MKKHDYQTVVVFFVFDAHFLVFTLLIILQKMTFSVKLAVMVTFYELFQFGLLIIALIALLKSNVK